MKKITDDSLLWSMYEEGRSLKAMGETFKCSKVAVFKRLRKLKKMLSEKVNEVDGENKSLIEINQDNVRAIEPTEEKDASEIIQGESVNPEMAKMGDQFHGDIKKGGQKQDEFFGVIKKEEFSSNSKYLRKMGTNEVFAFSPILMERGDMLPYIGPIPVPSDFEIPKYEIELVRTLRERKHEGLESLSPSSFEEVNF